MHFAPIGRVALRKLAARERILRTAHDLFYSEGIRATGIDRVIERAGVAKVTFYRHFPSKNDLIVEYLQFRHARWMAWFRDALHRHGGNARAIVPALAEWFESPGFRGCAFINGVGEASGLLPEVVEIARNHKVDAMQALFDLLPASRQRERSAKLLMMAIEGAIVQAQYCGDIRSVLRTLGEIVDTVVPAAT